VGFTRNARPAKDGSLIKAPMVTNAATDVPARTTARLGTNEKITAVLLPLKMSNRRTLGRRTIRNYIY
jgi:hypothetical protein